LFPAGDSPTFRHPIEVQKIIKETFMTSPGKGTNSVPEIYPTAEYGSSQIRSQLKESHPSKVVQHLGRISRMCGWVITTTLLSALVLVPAVVVAQAPSPRFEMLHAFNGSDGNFVEAGVTLDAAGNIYGATWFGGDLNCSLDQNGCGVVFELNAAGKLKKELNEFNGSDGALPSSLGILSRDVQGNLYGTTNYGGDLSYCGGEGCGTVFKIDKTGHETVLYAFTGSNGDGAYPEGGVILDESGNLYGTTNNGGAVNAGTVFKIDKAGHETVLHSFTESSNGDGAAPDNNLVEDAAGNLYGTTFAGGITGGPCGALSGCGTVFKIDKAGHETVLYAFTGSNGDGNEPDCRLVFDKEGNLYGTTILGGIGVSGSGTVFKLTKNGKETWKETILYKFTGTDGDQPSGSIVFDGAGNLYGTTYYGGSFGYGTVFKLTKAQKEKETVLHNFSGGKDGNGPVMGVVIDNAGSLYGTTQIGGDLGCSGGRGSGCGVVFKINQ
jgi:uncharacterized repeat protein (TIGR03803 family)